jgi:3-hydroxyacyl-[acyl-carrier-protein] dehydratase
LKIKANKLKLINDLFQVIESSKNEDGFIATIQFNAAHVVYAGHFPGHPVTPGVIQMQIVHELSENYFSKRLKLITMPQCKFLKILNPKETSQIIVHIEFIKEDERISIKAWGENGKDVFFKLNAVYQFV